MPTFEHDIIDCSWTVLRFLQPFILINQVQYLITLHTLAKEKQNTPLTLQNSSNVLKRKYNISSDQHHKCTANQELHNGPSSNKCSLNTHLVWLLSIWCCFPKCYTITPHIRLGVKFEIVYTFWSIPLQWPFPSHISLWI